MQLRRGPPVIPPPVARVPELRVIKAPQGAVRAPRSWRAWKPLQSYKLRVVAGVLLVSVPLSVILGFVMATWSAQTSIDQTKARAEATAQSAAVRITDWVSERQAELRTLAQEQAGNLSAPDLQAQLIASVPSHPFFDGFQIFDLKGQVVASSAPGLILSATPSGGTFANSLSVETIEPIVVAKDAINWVITAPILGANEQPQGVVAGNIAVTNLERLLNPYGRDAVITQDQEAHIINAEHLLVYSSAFGPLVDESSALAKGALRTPAEAAIYVQAMAVGGGAAEIVDYRNHHVLAGYEPIPELGWAVVASIETATALALSLIHI